MSTTPLTEFRDRVSEIIDEIESTGGEFTITRHGRPVAVILSIDDYEALLETVNILSDADTLAAIDEGLRDIEEGRTSD